MHCDCRCVLALRGQAFWEVQDATVVMLIALWRSSGFPQRRGEALQILGFVSSFWLAELPCQPSHWEPEFFLCFSCSWSGHDVYAGWVFGKRQARVLRRPCLRDSPPSVPLAQGELTIVVAASVVHSRGAPGGVFRVRFKMVLPLCVMVTLHLLVWMSKGTNFELGVRRKWTEFQVFERLVFLVRVRGATLHSGLTVRRSLSQSLRFIFGRFFDATPAMLSMRGHFTKRLVQRDVQKDSGRRRTR